MDSVASDSRLVMLATLAHPRDLCCIKASVDVFDKRPSSAKSLYYSRILKCRQLIFSDSHIIAAPILETESRMLIVMNKKYYEKGEIKTTLEKLKISGSDWIPLTNDIFERCLQYTVATKIAPHWNDVKGYLVHGRSFLTSSEALPAVKLQISVKESKTTMIVWPLSVVLEPTKIEELGVSQKINEGFVLQPNGSILEKSIEAQWIHVLPNFAKGRIMQITRHIPENYLYNTYKEVKRHWKNMYGYRLPDEDEEEELTYYTISDSKNSTLSVIPSLCVRSHDLVLLNQVNPVHILEWFHDALLRKVAVICGENILSDRNLAYALPKEEDPCWNILGCASLVTSNIYKDIIENEPVVLTSISDSCFEKTNSTAEMEYKEAKVNISTDNEVSQSINVSCSEDKLMKEDFESMDKSIDTTQKKVVVNCDSTKPNTIFCRKPLQDIPPVLNLKNIENWPTSIKRTDTESKSLPVSSTKKSIYPENCHNDSHFIQTTLSRIALSAQKIEAVVSNSGSQGMQGFYTFPTQNLLMEQTRVSSQTCLSFKDMLSSGNQQVNIISSNGQTFMPDKDISLKRDASILGQNDILGLAKKKPRSRPQVQLDVDVELVARNNDLQRVNKITLVYWLRNKLVPCKVKDKKSDLVVKVMEYLNLPLEKVQ